ncbi:MAG TPA: helix-turn-helix domain-containing protein [Pyrinomonadaceae bacterium]|nr:helix-turn-helix domain-containing protein [Pyrinomonadaceae bacterium]
MSSKNSTKVEKLEFVERLIEVCGTSQPAEIARLLNVSYQAAKNYLQGRMPDTHVLLTISERTPYSLHWLLTGRGGKFAENTEKKDEEVFSDEMRAFVRREFFSVLNEVSSGQTDTVPPKIVVLSPEKIKEEKVMGEPVTFPVEQQ